MATLPVRYLGRKLHAQLDNLNMNNHCSYSMHSFIGRLRGNFQYMNRFGQIKFTFWVKLKILLYDEM